MIAGQSTAISATKSRSAATVWDVKGSRFEEGASGKIRFKLHTISSVDVLRIARSVGDRKRGLPAYMMRWI